MTKITPVTAVAILSILISTAVLAQEMGGATGPGSSYGVEPSASSYSFDYDWRGASFGGNSYAMYYGNDRACARRYGYYDPTSGRFLRNDGHRHRCR